MEYKDVVIFTLINEELFLNDFNVLIEEPCYGIPDKEK